MDRQNNTGSSDAGHMTHEVRSGTLWVTVTGSVGMAAATGYVTSHQEIWSAQSRIVWDLRAFDPSGVSSQDILNIPHAFAEIMELRAGGRTAVIVGKELDLVSRLAIALGEDRKRHISIRSFLDEQSAEAWLAGE
jgi:hypothetical protein